MPKEIPGVKAGETVPPTDSQGVKEEAASPAADVKDVTESSPVAKEEEGVKPATLLDAVRNATGDEPAAEKPPVSEPDTAKPAAAEAAETSESSTDVKTEEQEEEVKPDKDGRVPYERFKLKNDECNALRVKADEYDQVEQFMREHELQPADVARFYQYAVDCKNDGVTADELDKAVKIARAFKKDPAQALELLEPHYRAARLFTGDELPEDLQTKVESDMISIGDAKELASQRAKLALKQQQEEEQRAQSEQRSEKEQRSNAETAQLAARDALFDQWRTRDPDFGLKEDEIKERALFLSRNGYSDGSPQGVRTLFQTAYDDVTSRYRKIRGNKQPVTPLTSDGAATVKAKPEPKTLREAIANA